MSKSNHTIAQEAVKKLEVWLQSTRVVPMRNGKVNKTEICRILNISRSTLDSNSKLKSLIDGIPSTKLQSVATQNPEAELSKKFLPEIRCRNDFLEQENKILRAQNQELERELAVEIFLLKTGRLVW